MTAFDPAEWARVLSSLRLKYPDPAARVTLKLEQARRDWLFGPAPPQSRGRWYIRVNIHNVADLSGSLGGNPFQRFGGPPTGDGTVRIAVISGQLCLPDDLQWYGDRFAELVVLGLWQVFLLHEAMEGAWRRDGSRVLNPHASYIQNVQQARLDRLYTEACEVSDILALVDRVVGAEERGRLMTMPATFFSPVPGSTLPAPLWWEDEWEDSVRYGLPYAKGRGKWRP